MTDVNILINNLANGEPQLATNANGDEYTAIRPPTRTALQAVRALQQLSQRVQMDQATIRNLSAQIQQLMDDNERLRQLVKECNEITNSYTATSTASPAGTVSDSQTQSGTGN